MPMHLDDSELSFNLLLSDPSDFEGGGTSFLAETAGSTTAEIDSEIGDEIDGETDGKTGGKVEAEIDGDDLEVDSEIDGVIDAESGTVVRPRRGEMLSHFGRLFHSGVPVTRGTRYILAGFVGVESFASQWEVLRPGGKDATTCTVELDGGRGET